jgi:deoxyribose-phosphate aldolase
MTVNLPADQVARTIDHTLLKPEATAGQIDALCNEARRYGFGAVCINPVYVRRVAERLSLYPANDESDHRPAVVSVAGFPLGASTTATKADEARRAIDDGATEIDMVAAIGALIDGDRAAVRRDIEAVARVVHQTIDGGILKVILETGVLTKEQLIFGCRCCVEGEADFVKTSTGLHPCGGATVEQVQLLYRHGSPLKVKASGGIRTAAIARAMLEAGAARIGTSAGVNIVEEMRRADP